MPYGHASILLLDEGSEATEPCNKYGKIRPHSIRSLQFDQKVRPLSFRPEKFDLLTATPLQEAIAGAAIVEEIIVGAARAAQTPAIVDIGPSKTQ